MILETRVLSGFQQQQHRGRPLTRDLKILVSAVRFRPAAPLKFVALQRLQGFFIMRIRWSFRAGVAHEREISIGPRG